MKKITQEEKIKRMLLHDWTPNWRIVQIASEGMRRVRSLRQKGNKVLMRRGDKNGKKLNTFYYRILQ